MAALFDYSRWDNIVDSDDDAPLMAAPAAPEATVDPVARVGAKDGTASATALSRALALEHSATTDVAAIAAGLGMAPGATVASLQDALVKHGAGGQAAVLPLIAEARRRAAVAQRGGGAATDAASARSAAGTVARTEAKKQLRLARAPRAGGVDELEDTGAFRAAGPGEDLVNVMLRTLEDAETRIAERIVASAAASDEPGEKKREDKVLHTPFETVLARTAFKLGPGREALASLKARGFCGLRPLRDDGAAEAPLPVALGLPTIAALDASLFDVFERHEPDDEARWRTAAVQAVVGVAYELERGLELDDALAVPDAVRLAAYAPDGSARAKREDWSPYDDADDREIIATLFVNPRDWSHADGGTLVVHDDAGAAHHVLPLPGRLVVYLARTVPVEDRPCTKRPRFSLSCAFDRRAPGYDKLKDQAERSGEAVSAKFMGPMYTDLGPSDVTVVEGATPFEPGDHDKESDIGLV
ncbi:N-methylnicotinate transmembrane transporter [Aureococcus anophagefferens]|nr:N-methylnicotinate transmembrane transporter [Aureococcus anophagefferens]